MEKYKVALPFRPMVVMYRMLAIFTWYEMINLWATVYAFIRHPCMFMSTEFLFEKRIRLVTIDLSYFRLTYHTHDIQQECSGLATDSPHYCDVLLGANTSQITSLSIVYSTVYSDQWKHQSSASLAFVRGIHRFPAQKASNTENVSIWCRHHIVMKINDALDKPPAFRVLVHV